MKKRKEKDPMGIVWVSEDRNFGAQTQRSLENFAIGTEKIPEELITALLLLKKLAAKVNAKKKLLSPSQGKRIEQAVDTILRKKDFADFPLTVWQTGSGTHTNMNVNEVIAHFANASKGKKIHPNDQVNLCQSSNDIMPAALHVAGFSLVRSKLLPALKKITKTLGQKEKAFSSLVKIGRTHMMDAVPLTIGQEFSAFRSQLSYDFERIQESSQELLKLPLGATAVGTGINSFPTFGKEVCLHLKKVLKADFVVSENLFRELSFKQAVLSLSSELKILATHLFKMANDIRLAASGPRCGLREFILPANEPGSSIMPGKVNPTQCEALTMVCLQVMGNDTVISFANSQGQFQLNAYLPVICHNLFQSIHLLADAMISFDQRCLKELKVDRKIIKKYQENSLMAATALNRFLGYEKASKIVKKAYQKNQTLQQAALSEGIKVKEFNKICNLNKLTKPNL